MKALDTLTNLALIGALSIVGYTFRDEIRTRISPGAPSIPTTSAEVRAKYGAPSKTSFVTISGTTLEAWTYTGSTERRFLFVDGEVRMGGTAPADPANAGQSIEDVMTLPQHRPATVDEGSGRYSVTRRPGTGTLQVTELPVGVSHRQSIGGN